MIPAWADMWRTFGRIGLLSFDGPAAQIGLMHRELVAERGWLDERGLASAPSFRMMLPGPEAMHLAAYCGWRLRGTAGGLLAGLLFALPGASVTFALAALYGTRTDLPAVRPAFLGTRAVVPRKIVQAMANLSRHALKSPADVAIAMPAFAAIFWLRLPFPSSSSWPRAAVVSGPI
jgi:chromate transporter